MEHIPYMGETGQFIPEAEHQGAPATTLLRLLTVVGKKKSRGALGKSKILRVILSVGTLPAELAADTLAVAFLVNQLLTGFSSPLNLNVADWLIGGALSPLIAFPNILRSGRVVTTILGIIKDVWSLMRYGTNLQRMAFLFGPGILSVLTSLPAIYLANNAITRIYSIVGPFEYIEDITGPYVPGYVLFPYGLYEIARNWASLNLAFIEMFINHKGRDIANLIPGGNITHFLVRLGLISATSVVFIVGASSATLSAVVYPCIICSLGACCAAVTTYLTAEQGIKYLKKAFRVVGIYESIKSWFYDYDRSKMALIGRFLQRLNMRRFIESSIRTVKVMPPQGIISLWNMRCLALASLRVGEEQSSESSSESSEEDLETISVEPEEGEALDPRIIERALRLSSLWEANIDQRPLKNLSIIFQNPVVSLTLFTLFVGMLIVNSLFFSYNIYPFNI